MNKSRLKSYAPKARRDFIQAVTERAYFYGLSDKPEKIVPVEEKGDVAIIGGKAFPLDVAKQRKGLEERINREGFIQVMEAVAYTWFNRFLALRYMGVNNYLDHGFRVLSHPSGSHIPEIMEHAAEVSLPGLNRDEVVDLKLDGNKDSDLYRMILVAQCNALHASMPFLFEKINDETELLLPDNLLHSDSIIRKLVTEIDEEDWKEVEIVGWLYQFYISEKKDQVIGNVVKSEDIPAATQLFTPNWIVKYMVQNSLGRMWMATYPNSSLKEKMEYYIEPAGQTDDLNAQLAAIIPELLDPEKLTLIDPASGSGHILVEAYDLLKEIYLERGYRLRDIPRLILEKNLYGLDIDDRAAQMAGFALLMKARGDDRKILSSENPSCLNVMAIHGSEGINSEAVAADLLRDEETDEVTQEDILNLIELFHHGKTFGSLIIVPEELVGKLNAIHIVVDESLRSGHIFTQNAARTILPFVQQAIMLSGKYDCVVANPPYMGGKGMNGQLATWVKENYPDVKSDLFSAFIVRNTKLALPNGQLGFMTPFVWMFLSSYEKLRSFLINHKTITSLVQLEYSGFDGATVPICTFTLENAHHPDFKGGYVRLSDFRGSEKQAPKTLEAIRNPDCGWFYRASAADFNKIPGSPIAYWAGEGLRNLYSSHQLAGDASQAVVGLQTGDNDRFMRFWYEVDNSQISSNFSNTDESKGSLTKWVPYNKGGSYRKWYGNREYVVNWEDDGSEIRNFKDERGTLRSRPQNTAFYFREAITWSEITSSWKSFRYNPPGSISDVKGQSAYFSDRSCLFKTLAWLNSNIVEFLTKILNPTLSFQSGDYRNIPLPFLNDKLGELAKRAVEITKIDWDTFEISSDFQSSPLVGKDVDISNSYLKYRTINKALFAELIGIEKDINGYLIKEYALQDDIRTDVQDEQITLTCNPHYRYGGDRNEEELETLLQTDTMKELISYAIGCMMGRYSLDQMGMVYAHSWNEGFDSLKYPSFPADDDGIIPVTDLDWFDDDAANRFEEFMRVAWSPDTLEENLRFIAESLTPKRGESSRDTIRRYFSIKFFKDHLKTHKKRPNYWLFSSGKEKAFECLVYLHRYNESTLSRMRNEYVIPLQGKYSTHAEFLAHEIENATSASASNKLQKELDALRKKQVELSKFDEELRHYSDQRIKLDLDDGVKVNYGKFGNLLAEVKAITGKK